MHSLALPALDTKPRTITPPPTGTIIESPGTASCSAPASPPRGALPIQGPREEYKVTHYLLFRGRLGGIDLDPTRETRRRGARETLPPIKFQGFPEDFLESGRGSTAKRKQTDKRSNSMGIVERRVPWIKGRSRFFIDLNIYIASIRSGLFVIYQELGAFLKGNRYAVSAIGVRRKNDPPSFESCAQRRDPVVDTVKEEPSLLSCALVGAVGPNWKSIFNLGTLEITIKVVSRRGFDGNFSNRNKIIACGQP